MLGLHLEHLVEERHDAGNPSTSCLTCPPAFNVAYDVREGAHRAVHAPADRGARRRDPEDHLGKIRRVEIRQQG